METSSLNSEEMELQQMQLSELELHQKCLALFEKLKKHLGFLHRSFNFINPRIFEIAFRIFFREEHQTFREKMYHNLNQLQWQLERDSCQGHNFKTCLEHDSKTCLVVLRTQFNEFFDSKEVNASDFQNKCWQKNFIDGATLEACLVNEGRALDDNLVIKETIDDSVTSSEQLDESSSSQQPHVTFPQLDSGLVVPTFIPTDDPIACLHKAMAFMVTVQQVQGRHGQNVAGMGSKEKIMLVQIQKFGQVLDEGSRNDADAKKMLVDMTTYAIENDDIGPSYDSDTVFEVHLDMFENMFAHGIQNHEQPKSSPDTYVVNENNSDISSYIPNMYPDRGKEEHVDVNYEQQRACFASLINNLKCDVEKCNKIKLLNDEISYLKSQACEKVKTFVKENEKFNEYVQPLLNRKNELEKKNQEFLKKINDLDNRLRKARQTDQTLRMLLPKEDNVNTGKQGLGFENQNDDVNPSLLNKANELAPCLYNIVEKGKDELSDHKIISEEKLKCEAEKRLKVKQRKSPLSYHGFVYAETQFEEPPKVPFKRINVNLKEHLEQVQLRNYDGKL
ncbi:hypothetical protein Tco_1151607 [Tanacetum coccineum]